MKTNCPHCEGELIIPVQCCRGDLAVQAILTPKQHEEYEQTLKDEAEKEKLKNEKIQQARKEFLSYKKATRFNLRIFFCHILLFIICIFVSLLTGYMFVKIFPQTINDFWPSLFMLILLGMIIFAGEARIEGYQEKIKKEFLAMHPEYEEIQNKII